MCMVNNSELYTQIMHKEKGLFFMFLIFIIAQSWFDHFN